MSDSKPSRVFLAEGGDPEMQNASERARSTFGFFWREVHWERRRIIPGLDMAAVKAPFRDDDSTVDVEHMWMGEVDFDGRRVAGALLNAPRWLKEVKQGDNASVPLAEISDWMYVISGQVFGAYTVNLLRSRMDVRECRDHDAAWGLDFGDPAQIRVVPEPSKGGGFLKKWFGGRKPDAQEHPMSVNMAEKYREQLATDPSLVTVTDDRGWTFLHQEALAGNSATVKVLLDAGADTEARTEHGMTAAQLAGVLGWDRLVSMLTRK